MEFEFVTVEETLWEKAKRKAKRTGKVVWEATKEFCADNKEVVATTAIGLATWAIKDIKKSHDSKKEQEFRELYIYDRSMGVYHKLRKPLTNSQKVEINSRHAAGEPMYVILNNMRLL